MQPHEQRVLEEKQELDARLVLLTQFISASPIFRGLDVADRQLLRDQQGVMMDYSDILARRIARFTP